MSSLSSPWPQMRPESGHLLTGSPEMMRDVRADRLVAVLMLLQTRGRVTAAEVAAELEISERTARRDLDALGMAGLPVYSQPGRNGGWQLARRRPDRPQRTERGRGAGAVPRRRARRRRRPS